MNILEVFDEEIIDLNLDVKDKEEAWYSLSQKKEKKRNLHQVFSYIIWNTNIF